MMPRSKGLSPHELAHRWVKDLLTPTSFLFLLIYILTFLRKLQNTLCQLSLDSLLYEWAGAIGEI